MDLDLWEKHAYAHSEGTTGAPPTQRQRQLFGMLVAVDFQCHKYGDAPEGTLEEVKEYLLAHKAEVMTLRPPSYIGLLGGALDFLMEPTNGR